MIRDQLIQLLGWRLGDRTDMGERIIAEMPFVQRQELEQHAWLPWFLETELAEALTAPGDARVALPEDFLAEIDEQHLWIVKEAGQPSVELLKWEYDDAKRQFPGSGEPVAYAVTGRYFHLFPTPELAYPVQMRYYAMAPDMSLDNSETPWLKYASDVVLNALGRHIAGTHLQNPQLAERFAADLQNAWTTLYTRHTARQEVNMERALGGRT